MERFLPALRHAAHAIVECFERSSPRSAAKPAGNALIATET
jgi:hypothetical protein